MLPYMQNLLLAIMTYVICVLKVAYLCVLCFVGTMHYLYKELTLGLS